MSITYVLEYLLIYPFDILNMYLKFKDQKHELKFHLNIKGKNLSTRNQINLQILIDITNYEMRSMMKMKFYN